MNSESTNFIYNNDYNDDMDEDYVSTITPDEDYVSAITPALFHRRKRKRVSYNMRMKKVSMVNDDINATGAKNGEKHTAKSTRDLFSENDVTTTNEKDYEQTAMESACDPLSENDNYNDMDLDYDSTMTPALLNVRKRTKFSLVNDNIHSSTEGLFVTSGGGGDDDAAADDDYYDDRDEDYVCSENDSEDSDDSDIEDKVYKGNYIVLYFLYSAVTHQ